MLALHRVANESSNRVIGSVDYIKLEQCKIGYTFEDINTIK